MILQDSTIGIFTVNRPSSNTQDLITRKSFFGHMNNVKVIDFDDRYIVTGSKDKLVEVRQSAINNICFGQASHHL